MNQKQPSEESERYNAFYEMNWASDWDKTGKECRLWAWKPLGNHQFGTLIER
jgi:hypothetical protein